MIGRRCSEGTFIVNLHSEQLGEIQLIFHTCAGGSAETAKQM